ncbi:MAG: NYN domain-containing protein, partial [SAR202 cluster bacterium]|nr:NYN domain-containing protein [SAR202 cluster bacterium]
MGESGGWVTRGGHMTTNSERVAVFIDVENLLISAQNAGLPFNLGYILDRARQEGPLMCVKAYADWNAPLLRPVQPDFRQHAVEQAQLGTFHEKNTADIQIAVDAVEMALSDVKPKVIVIVGGDRDFVPLVQKLRRYDIKTVGIGIEGVVSKVLSQACEQYVFYDDLLPERPKEEQELRPPAEPDAVLPLVRRAVEALLTQGRVAAGASVSQMMQQLDPTFTPTRFGLTFKELCLKARDAGYVKLSERPGSDFTLTLSGIGPAQTVIPAPVAPPRREYEFSSVQAAVASYRAILQEQRIPLIPWAQRRALVERLWSTLRGAAPTGQTLSEMREDLLQYAQQQAFDVYELAIRK